MVSRLTRLGSYLSCLPSSRRFDFGGFGSVGVCRCWVRDCWEEVLWRDDYFSGFSFAGEFWESLDGELALIDEFKLF